MLSSIDSREKGELEVPGLGGGLAGPLGSDGGTLIVILSRVQSHSFWVSKLYNH